MEQKPMIVVSPAQDPDYIKLSVEGGHVYVVNHHAETVAQAIHSINHGREPENGR